MADRRSLQAYLCYEIRPHHIGYIPLRSSASDRITKSVLGTNVVAKTDIGTRSDYNLDSGSEWDWDSHWQPHDFHTVWLLSQQSQLDSKHISTMAQIQPNESDEALGGKTRVARGKTQPGGGG